MCNDPKTASICRASIPVRISALTIGWTEGIESSNEATISLSFIITLAVLDIALIPANIIAGDEGSSAPFSASLFEAASLEAAALEAAALAVESVTPPKTKTSEKRNTAAIALPNNPSIRTQSTRACFMIMYYNIRLPS